MLVYRPSRGNNSVALTYSGDWAGKSIGGEIITKEKFGPSDYFLWYSSDLSNDSSWFLKPITNIDFTTGLTYYRSFYIGPNEKENLQEYVSTLNSSVTTCDISSTSDINVSLWSEGVFTEKTSKESLVLENEYDSTNKLVNAVFTNNLLLNTFIQAGQWLKVWVKINVPINPLLVDDDLCYIANIGALSLEISKDISRLSLSKVFHGDLICGDIIAKELIPTINDISTIHKVINKPDQTHIFFSNTDKELHNLIIERHNNAYDNKFIDVNVSHVTGPITGFNTFSDNTLYAVQDVFTCMLSSDESQKYIVDILSSNIPDRNYYYIFYNELKKCNDGQTVSTSAETFVKYEANYLHSKYSWSSGVILLDFNMFKKETFVNQPAGFDNKTNANNWVGQDNKIRDDYFITSISFQDDLFTAIGYNTENSYQTYTPASTVLVSSGKNYFTEMTMVWEKDILLNNVSPQTLKAPSIAVVNTIKERSLNNSQLIIDNWVGIDSFNLSHTKQTHNLLDMSGNLVSYCDLGSPHGNKLKHYEDASIWFDTQDILNEWSSTFAFRLPSVSIDISSATFNYYDKKNASQNHILYDIYYKNTINGELISNQLISTPPSLSGEISIFSVNVKNSDYKSIELIYDPILSNINVITRNTSGGFDVNTFNKNLYLGQDNVISVNTIKTQVSDFENCSCKSMVNYEIYVNGDEISTGSSFVFDSLDPLVLKYNPNKKFGGSLSYFEINSYIDDISGYANAMYNIHANIAWSHPLYDTINTNKESNELQIFKNKRIVNINNLTHTNTEIIIPITLLGTGYLINDFSLYNNNVLRTSDLFINKPISFDFKKINLNNIDLAFTSFGDNKLLEWSYDEYDVLNDRLTIWVKLDRYVGQKLVMYYNAQRVSSLSPYQQKNAFKNLIGVWTMNEFSTTYGYRFNDQKIFNSGENVLFLQRDNDKYLLQIDYQYMYGYKNIYKSNKFDVAYDDRNIDQSQMSILENFMGEYVDQFKPDYMTINKIRSKFNYTLEIDNYTPKE
jgi:hypothetical protein